jgi:two-component system, chemotaxis family, sensor kinase Cph1
MKTEIEQALANCSREPIHTPGAIQPFGVLLALDDDLRVTQCSENLDAAFDRPLGSIFGCPIEDLIKRDLRPFIKPGDFEAGEPLRLDSPVAARHWDAFLHRHRGRLILELEWVAAEAGGNPEVTSSGWLRTAFATLGSTTSIAQLCERACEQIKQLTGLDGVMAYKFHQDGHGEVVAECKDEEWPKYLGLHYPASDIPAQARAIFLENWIRMIPDRDYVPSRLISAATSGAPLDLGRSLLRSVSPVHIEYLRNMGVRASLTLSLISEGRLWGLIAGHHYRGPLHVSAGRRAVAELVARLTSQQLAIREQEEIAGVRDRGRKVLLELVRNMKAASELADGLTGQSHDARDLLGCGGAAVALPGGGWKRIGATPAREQLEQLATWLDQRDEDSQVFSSDGLALEYPQAADFSHCASGLLALRIPKGRGNYILWFKPEIIRTVSWAGDPNKPVAVESSSVRLRPRTSFDVWTETVRMKSLPWMRWEIELAEALGSAAAGIDLQRQFERELQARAAAEWANDQKEQLLAMVSHDLKNPLHSLMVGITLVQRTLPADPPGKVSTVLRGMQRSLQRMGHLIDDLLSLARLESGSIALEVKSQSAAALLADTFDLLQPIAVDKGVQLEIAPDSLADCRLQCDRERVLQVLSNLVGNAVKFTPGGGNVRCRLSKAGREACFSIADTGPGIAQEHLSYVFDRFWQAQQTRRLGTGLGLSIAQGLVVAHGGRIWVESGSGQGSVFHFTLPLAPEELNCEQSS